MFVKLLAATAFAAIADAQTASNSFYTAQMDTVKSGTADLLTSNFSTNIQELISGDNSFTVQSMTFAMTLARGTWIYSGRDSSQVTMAVFYPFMKKGDKNSYFAPSYINFLSGRTSLLAYGANSSELTAVPTFVTTNYLMNQL